MRKEDTDSAATSAKRNAVEDMAFRHGICFCFQWREGEREREREE